LWLVARIDTKTVPTGSLIESISTFHNHREEGMDRFASSYDDDGVLPLPPPLPPAAGGGVAAAGGVAGFVRGLDFTNVQGPVIEALLALSDAVQHGGTPSAAAASVLKVEWLASAVADLQRRVRKLGWVIGSNELECSSIIWCRLRIP
jgi:hypothetical protein